MNTWLLIMVLSSGFFLFASSNKTPPVTGSSVSRLASCPDSPNCVSSQSSDKKHYVEPLSYKGSLNQTRKDLIAAIVSMKRSTIVTSEDRYLRAEFTSALFRFVDDLECYCDDAQRLVHVRSASRTGYYDFGVNRRRVEDLRIRYEALNNSKE